MFRRVVEVAPIAALLAIGVPQPSADAMSVPSLKSEEATVLVGERERRGGDRGERRRGGDDDGRRRVFRHDDGDRREFRRHHRRDDRDRWFGFGRPYYYGDYGDCGWLRRRAIETGSSYWWRRYRDCRGW
jgi:hypothetical protein